MKSIFYLLPAVTSARLIESNFYLPQDDPRKKKRSRKLEKSSKEFKYAMRKLELNDVTYRLNYGPDLDSGGEAQQLVIHTAIKNRGNGNNDIDGIDKITSRVRIKTIDDYDTMYARLKRYIPIPYSQDISDAAFGEDRLTIKGHHRLLRVTDLDIDLSLHESKVVGVCDNSLEAMVATGKLYKEDYAFASKYNDKRRPQKYTPSVIGYFCVTKEEKFMPLAINVLDNGLIYSPYDEEQDWLLAKMSLNTAGINVQMFDHFVHSHLLLEPIRVALHRQISTRHPLYNLMEHHFTGIFVLTRIGFKLLLSSDLTVDNIFGWGASGAAKYLEDELPTAPFTGYKQQIKLQGLDDIPNFKLRDDGITMWDALESFVTGFLIIYYPDTSSLIYDNEIQNWAAESCKYQSDFPCSFESVPQLAQTIVNIIFRISVLHHAWNSDVTWHVNAYPYSIASMNHPLPTRKGSIINFMDYMHPLSDLQDSVRLYARFYRPMDSKYTTLIDSYNDCNFGRKLRKVVSRHQNKLRKIDLNINNRERQNKRPFEFLKPSRLPHSAWV